MPAKKANKINDLAAPILPYKIGPRQAKIFYGGIDIFMLWWAAIYGNIRAWINLLNGLA